MECWLGLSHFPPAEAVLHIRLQCTPALQRSLDSRYTIAQWQALSTAEALDAISRVALQTTNQAADWCKFFATTQGPSESICEYFTRSTQCAADCEFECPHCAGSLSEYMLLRKLVCGLRSVALKEEVFRQCQTFGDVDVLRKFCVAFEAAHKDARQGDVGGNSGRESWAAAAGVTPLPGAQEALPPQTAGIRQTQPTFKR